MVRIVAIYDGLIALRRIENLVESLCADMRARACAVPCAAVPKTERRVNSRAATCPDLRRPTTVQTNAAGRVAGIRSLTPSNGSPIEIC